MEHVSVSQAVGEIKYENRLGICRSPCDRLAVALGSHERFYPRCEIGPCTTVMI